MRTSNGTFNVHEDACEIQNAPGNRYTHVPYIKCRKVEVGEFVYYQDVPAVKWDDIFKAGPD